MYKLAIEVYRWVFARNIFQKINIVIFQLSLRGMGVLNHENDKVSGERYFIKKILPQIVRKSPILLDVGSNVGNYTLSLLETFPDAQIHAFEPHPANFAVLKNNVSSPNVKLHNLAIGECQGDLTLYDRADHKNGSSHASLHKAVISEIHKQEILKFTVSVETLDDFCAREEIVEIDFIKIDTEGNELSVLHGAEKLIRNNNIKCIHFEFNEMNIVSRAFFRDFRKVLENYRFYRLLPHGLVLLNDTPLLTELFAYQNIIAVEKSTKIAL